ncbi:hypothetical protein QVD17_03889 [Tagetes erecta]|uniref:Uncharacterized protein n=1 Tax=Tagetes erecta TaxID=13708 RepID=A0AAD8LFI2_TARER|nr:hypothetical protein QVD17_03889 [Tagetes erecta]
MANNHGGSGSKFVSVNLNKLYGQPSHHNYQSHSGSYGLGNRARPGSAGGGMVVLSRNRPLQKATSKLSVPPPLNLPSLRKEYEKIDLSGAGGGVAGGGGSGNGSRPSSSGMGWTKPRVIALNEKEVTNDTHVSESVTKGGGAYLPPSARFGGDTVSAYHSNVVPVEKAMVLRGEDFPSLRAALPSSTGPAQKQQKEGSLQRVKQLASEESSNDLGNSSHLNSPSHTQSSHQMANGVNENRGQISRPNFARSDIVQKLEDPLSLIWTKPRSDWADDERDTSHGFVGRSGRDQGSPKSRTYWDRDFDTPRSSILPHKPPNSLSERHGQPIAKGSTSEVLKAEPYSEFNSWRNTSVHKDRSTGPHAINEGNNITWPNNFSNSTTHHGVLTGQGRPGVQRHWNHRVESPRNRNEGYQKSTASKSVYSLGVKAAFPKSEQNYVEDSYQKDYSSSVYDEKDPFTGNLVGLVKRKKGVIEQSDFHDPVRESFEAELERVQKMQEMERQRIVGEQERALEQARREDEERRIAVLEEEERQRRMEEEAREAAWRAEQERFDAIQKAEEQKIAREEEKRRMLLEEERRKQAAKQKLLDLEARMAKRNVEVVKTGPDDVAPVGGKDSDASMDSDLDNWEVSQRMVERITASASSDSSAMDRHFDQPQFSREVSTVERRKPVNPWKREAFDVGSSSSFLLNDQENGRHSPRREAPVGGRSFPRKDYYGGGYMSSRSPDTDGFSHLGDRDHRWNSFGDGEAYGRNRETDSEFYDNVGEKYGEAGWGQGHSRTNNRSYPDQLYMNAESDKLYSHGRSRYSMKQPRVLPPPSLSSVPRSSVRGENELSGPSSSLESTARTGNYGGPLDNFQQDVMAQKLEKNDTLRCDSQSSLSVSSPPSSPTPLSHDELDDSGGCSVAPIGGEGKEVNDEPGEVTATLASKSVTTDEDEEWNLDSHDEMQEQEEYDEEDGYGEEDEVLEGPDDNIKLTQEFEHLQIEEKSTTDVMENRVLGFNDGVEVRVPGEEFEKDSKTDVMMADIPEVPIGVIEKQAAVDAVIHEHEQTQNAYISTSCSLLGDQVSSSGQSTTPVKLQFGLFSGPTLIPSPVPAIQIGSIQMPLHLHPPVGSSLSHLHPSQPAPLFQFGQMMYSSSVSQGILPMNQHVSLVQPNFHHTHTHFNLDQNSESFLPNQLSQGTSAVNMNKDAGSANLLTNQGNVFHVADNINASKPVIQTEEQGHGTSNNDSQIQYTPALSRGVSAEKNVPLSKAPGPSNRGKRTVYPARNSVPRSFQAYEPTSSNEYQRKHRRPIQRTEFRIRENFNNAGLDDKLNNKGMGTSTRSGFRRQMGPAASLKRVVHGAGMISESRPGKETARTKTQTASSPVESNLKRNVREEDVDAPLQSGVVRVFEQPGIECLSDEDDFIEVRSKRQMLNDRRERREKEIKAKSRASKQPRKAHVISSGHKNKTSTTLVSEASNNIRSDVGVLKKEQTIESSTMAHNVDTDVQRGTATVDTDIHTGIRLHTSKPLQCGSAIPGAAEHGSDYMFETETKVFDGGWGDTQSDQQVIPLTQVQLDEAMKPSRFNTKHITSIGDRPTLDNDPILPSSILTKGKSDPSSSSPINSLLAGQKIQFGAVTSPTMLSPSSHVVSHAVGAPGSFRSDMSQSISKAENDCNIFFKKDERSIDDCEAEVEAAASTVAVAAIDTDEIAGNGLCHASFSGTKSLGGAVEVIQGEMAGDQQSGSRSKPEESLSVSLPADLSVETPPMSLWPPLPSPQGPSTQMISHFPGPAPSHFPFYDMNHPMMSSPVFAFSRHDESGGTQSQSQKPTGLTGSRHIGSWQNHSGVESFYGPPSGFTGPFIGAPGVQASPHMVVYNHYSPVGQFGQVGLSFMGPTYIPSGKQPDWKHDPTSSSRSEDLGSVNVVSGPRNPPPNIQPSIQQHLAPGSPLLPMGSPLTMFDVPPFQTAPDMSVQARWSQVPASPLHAVPMSSPLQQQADVVIGPSQFSSHGGHPVDQSNRLSEPQAPSTSVVRDSTITHFPDELGLLDSSGPSMSTTSPTVTASHITSGTTKTEEGGGGISSAELKNQHPQVKNLSSSQQYNNTNNNYYGGRGGGYGYQRSGGVPPKNKSTGGQWSNRRAGFHGRYQSSDKSFPSATKVKQIYVAKQPVASGGSSSREG